jgi:hypothetical protein
MYTIDTLIERLQELREIAPDGGDTPVVMPQLDSESGLEPVEVSLQDARPSTTSARTGQITEWFISRTENTCKVICVF